MTMHHCNESEQALHCGRALEDSLAPDHHDHDLDKYHDLDDYDGREPALHCGRALVDSLAPDYGQDNDHDYDYGNGQDHDHDHDDTESDGNSRSREFL